MLKINNKNEYWREELLSFIGNSEETHSVDLDLSSYDEFATELKNDVLCELDKKNVQYEMGAFGALSELGRPAEIEILNSAVESCSSNLEAEIDKYVQNSAI